MSAVLIDSIHVANVRAADTGVHDVDLETFYSWFITDEDSSSSLQSPEHGMKTPRILCTSSTTYC